MTLQDSTASGRTGRTSRDEKALSRGDLLARQHECLAKADLFAVYDPTLSDSWLLLARQWQLLLDMTGIQGGWDRRRPEPPGSILLQ